ncbi:MAG: class I SAM-dependent methyltransferase [bacterium]
MKKIDIIKSYDNIAEDYAKKYCNELQDKPFDCMVLEKYATSVKEGGVICDVGCGPGHIATYLSKYNLRVVGVDLSESMLKIFNRINPGLEYAKGEIGGLPFLDNSFDGIVAFYSLIHIERRNVICALQDMARVLKADGVILLAFHMGNTDHSCNNWFGKKVSIDITNYEIEEMARYLRQAGFEIESVNQREPYKKIELSSQRGFVQARKLNSA